MSWANIEPAIGIDNPHVAAAKIASVRNTLILVYSQVLDHRLSGTVHRSMTLIRYKGRVPLPPFAVGETRTASIRLDVRFWHLADIKPTYENVRFRG